MPLEAWEGFFVAEAGAAAALAGLLFVAVSINLARILEYPNLPTRAGEALAALVVVLAVATIGLVPHQSQQTFGAAILGVGIVFWISQAIALARTLKLDRQYGWLPSRILMNQAPPLPYIAAGALMLAGRGEGVYWIAPGVLACFAASLYGAWVLLVEIQR